MQRFPDADKELKDKFLVQSAFIDPDPSIDVIEHWKGLQERERREQVKPYAEKKLKSVLEVPGRVSLPALNFFGNSISFVRIDKRSSKRFCSSMFCTNRCWSICRSLTLCGVGCAAAGIVVAVLPHRKATRLPGHNTAPNADGIGGCGGA